MAEFDLFGYLNKEIEQLIADVLKSSLKNPKESAFFLKYRSENSRNEKTRQTYENKGVHIPPFLIASITTECNLFCKGCYARANSQCSKTQNAEPMNVFEWKNVFAQASLLGVSFILLAGGEPLIRRDVIASAANVSSILFPVFTNGTLIDSDYLDLFDKHRNLIPILSIEGSREITDDRRGMGTFAAVFSAMQKFKDRGILFGTSLTVTSENAKELTSPLFLESLMGYGSKLAFYISYVPVEEGTEHLAQTEEQRAELEQTLAKLRVQYPRLIFLSFPGDEKMAGGCLAAGRGFFHINAQGDAEACPFAPYSDRSLRQQTLLQVLKSPFFQKLKDAELVGGEHDGGCTLFAHDQEVKKLLDAK